ncbi:MAG TPA: zinc-dependent metalloprotease [Actinomycetes bacterium]|nr:zinc-dependent metalloprotease [Actinomycetes bacterium]
MPSTDELIDWGLAAMTADRLVRPGPQVSRAEAEEVVADLRRYADAAVGHVYEVIGLQASTSVAPIMVVDRRGWVRANMAGLREVLIPLAEKVEERRSNSKAGDLALTVGSRVTGFEVGTVLAYLSSRVLGQYELFGESSNGSAGSLLLVAPNVVHIERELKVTPSDFRLWVCIHEETHRVQFTAVPWLRDHLRGEIREFLSATEIDPTAMAQRLRAALEVLVDSARNQQRGESAVSLLDVVQTAQQREILDRLSAVMSLLEGHAEYVMDAVGPQVIPSVTEIRQRFQRRRIKVGRFDQTVRRLLGIDAKLRQYRDGERFVRTVVEQVGMNGFNRVWTSPDTLPTAAEISDPDAWVRRVHGGQDTAATPE